jgi:hypothetical protein
MNYWYSEKIYFGENYLYQPFEIIEGKYDPCFEGLTFNDFKVKFLVDNDDFPAGTAILNFKIKSYFPDDVIVVVLVNEIIQDKIIYLGVEGCFSIPLNSELFSKGEISFLIENGNVKNKYSIEYLNIYIKPNLTLENCFLNTNDENYDSFIFLGQYIRRVKNAAFDESAALNEKIKLLAKNKLLIEFIHFDGLLYQDLKHSIPARNFTTHCFKDAALLWIEINLLLLEDNAGLVDGHLGNFVLTLNSKPIFCDIGSIKFDSNNNLNRGLAEFIHCFVYPILWISCSNDLREIREILSSTQSGISYDFLKENFPSVSEIPDLLIYLSKYNRSHKLTFLHRMIRNLELNKGSGYLSNYRDDINLQNVQRGDLLINKDLRYKFIIDFLVNLNESSFLDIGGNDGAFAIMLSNSGMKGYICDLEEYSLNKLYGFLKSTEYNYNLSVFHSDFKNVTVVADVVLALALTHHLFFISGYSFEYISKKLSDNNGKYLLVEFMPLGRGGNLINPGPGPNPLPEIYNLDNFINSLKINFEVVEVLSYARGVSSPEYPDRILVFCTK